MHYTLKIGSMTVVVILPFGYICGFSLLNRLMKLATFSPLVGEETNDGIYLYKRKTYDAADAEKDYMSK